MIEDKNQNQTKDSRNVYKTDRKVTWTSGAMSHKLDKSSFFTLLI